MFTFVFQGGNGAAHINVNWCFLCTAGGSLVCCERCPASFHLDCLTLEPGQNIEDSYYCDNCQSGRLPLYQEVVWVKFGSYRWWPAVDLRPQKVKGNQKNTFLLCFLTG